MLVTTYSSYWLIDPYARTYTRTRRDPLAPRRHTPSLANRLADDAPHKYRWCTFIIGVEYGVRVVRLRILPVAGPPDGYGILSGPVEHLTA